MSNLGPAPLLMTRKISPSVDPRSHLSSVRFDGCVPSGAIGPLPLASVPWQKRQFFWNAACPALIDSGDEATGFFIFLPSGLPPGFCAPTDTVMRATHESASTEITAVDTRRMMDVFSLLKPAGRFGGGDSHTPVRRTATIPLRFTGGSIEVFDDAVGAAHGPHVEDRGDPAAVFPLQLRLHRADAAARRQGVLHRRPRVALRDEVGDAGAAHRAARLVPDERQERGVHRQQPAVHAALKQADRHLLEQPAVPLLPRAEIVLRAPAPRDVFQHHQRARPGTALAVVRRRHRDAAPDRAAVGAAVALLALVPLLAPADEGGEPRALVRLIVRVAEIAERHAAPRRARIAERALHRRVDALHQPALVQQRRAERRVVPRGTELSLAGAQRRHRAITADDDAVDDERAADEQDD